MNVHVRSSFSLFLSILRSPLPHCPHHHWATVEVVSGRGMMPNLTGVEPYLYSLHSRFCFKGFVYTRPINHPLHPTIPQHLNWVLVFGTLCDTGANVNPFLLREEMRTHQTTVFLTCLWFLFWFSSGSRPLNPIWFKIPIFLGDKTWTCEGGRQKKCADKYFKESRALKIWSLMTKKMTNCY